MQPNAELRTHQINGTPLVRVEAGTLLCIDDSCFSPPSLFAVPSGDVSVAGSTASSAASNSKLPPQLTRGFSALLAGIESDFPGVCSSDRSPDELPLFHLDLVFKSTCNYIRLPKRELKKALKEENYSTTAEIVRQLNVVSQSIISRISDLDIWNSANIGVRIDPKEPVEGATWGALQKEEHKSKHIMGGKVVKGLHGTYRLPSAMIESISEETRGQNSRDEDAATPRGGAMLAEKSKVSQLFTNTALDDD